MPQWAGKWKGGRYYFDPAGKPVYFIERLKRSVKLKTQDEDLANGQLAQFLQDPEAFCRPPSVAPDVSPVFITKERLALYLDSISGTVPDHQAARRACLVAWSDLGLDLRKVDRQALRVALAGFDAGHRGRVEALNAFARFLVREGDLPAWNPLVNHRPPKETRAERVVYSLEQLREAYARVSQPMRDVLLLRASTGMHQTEIDQIEGVRMFTGPLPDKGAGIRVLGGEHAIQGVLQVRHKSRHRHRQSLTAEGLAAVLRLRAGVPSRVGVWKALDPLVPSNLRHTFVTLAGEIGTLVTYTEGGVDRARIAQAVGHRAGSTMTADRYEKAQVPPMILLPSFTG